MVKSSHEKKIRRQVVQAILMMLAGVVLLLVSQRFYSEILILTSRGIAIILLLAGSALFLMLYLKGDINITFLDRIVTTPPSDTDIPYTDIPVAIKDEIARINKDMLGFKKQITLIPKSQLKIDDSNWEKILSSVREHITKDLVSELESKYSTAVIKSAQMIAIRNTIDTASSQLKHEIASLIRRGNINLVIGTLTTGVALSLLVYMVITADIDVNDMSAVLSYYIPRIAIVTLIEVCSFFFLKLHKASLSEIKYYQNELTNIAFHSVAIESCYPDQEGKKSGAIVEQFVKVDRNALDRQENVKGKSGLPTFDAKDIGDIISKLTKLLVETGKKSK